LSTTVDPLAAVVESLAQRTAELVLERMPAPQEPPEPNRWLDLNGALDYLGWGQRGKSRLYNLTAAEAIPFTKYGQRLYFDRADLDAFIDRHRRGR
jgi:Helix-turn-helix domain